MSNEKLQYHYQNRQQAALKKHHEGVPVIGYTSNTVPTELIEAAGFFPVLVDADLDKTPHADEFMEPVFDKRTKSIFEEILSGKWSFLKAIIIPRTSEAEHKLFLYLTEAKRLTKNPNIPEIYFFDFLHSQKELSRKYSFQQMVLLKTYLEKIAENEVSNERLNEAIELSNNVKNTINQLLTFRKGNKIKISGTEAMTIIGASYFMGKAVYLTEIQTVLATISQRKPFSNQPKILIKGFPLNNLSLHQKLENEGNIVVAEDDWFGSRAAGNLIEVSENPLASLFEKYYSDTPSPRIFPAQKANEWFEKEVLQGIDKVVFYLPNDEDTYGWDYPKQKAFLDRNGIISIVEF